MALRKRHADAALAQNVQTPQSAPGGLHAHMHTVATVLPQERPGFRILIADDHVDSRDLYAFGLQRFGFEVLVATTGAEALALASTAPHPDAVLLDLVMPGLDGLDVIRELRSRAATRTVAALALSTDLEKKADAYAAGFDSFCLKPCPPDHVILQVIKLLLPRATTIE